MMHQQTEATTSPEFLLPPEQDVLDGASPAGLQSRRTLAIRRAVMLFLGVGSLALVLYFAAQVFIEGGLDLLEIGILATIAMSAPWTILGFWNSVIGLYLALVSKDPHAAVAPFIETVPAKREITSRVAVAMAIRNEDPQRAFARMRAIRRSLDDTGFGQHFDLHILSDTDIDQVAEAEQRLFERDNDALAGLGRAAYRRRTENTGFKAGNVWQFLQDDGARYELFVPLDADSLMSGGAILRLVQYAEAHPRIGIVQSLAVGAPAESAFGRIFQFGMRHGMRAFTLGSAWWQGDCGPFWGHNAVIRTAAFRQNCKLPELGGSPPFGGPILSHDQVEAVCMRRGGFEVRVLPVESESFEENPVTILDFIKREQRWCNGNMQYWPLLGMEGLKSVSRFQLLQAILMYLSGPAWMLLTLLGAARAILQPEAIFNTGLAIGLFCVMVGMSLAPKLVGAFYVAMQPGGVARYGGAGRFTLGMFIETVFSVLMAPVVALHLTIFLFGLFLGRKTGWGGQIRDAYGMEWATAARAFWPQTLFGSVLFVLLAWKVPGAVYWSAPVLAGLVLAIPLAVVTASPRLGRWLVARRLCATPEEFDRPAIFDLVEMEPVEAVKAA